MTSEHLASTEQSRTAWQYLDVWWRKGGWHVNGEPQSGLPDVMTHALLDEWGREGWELVSVLGQDAGDGYRWVFKRPA